MRLPLAGAFQVENALVAAGLAIATGSDAGRACSRRSRSSRAPRAGLSWSGETQRRADLRRLRPQARRARQGARGAAALRARQLIVVFGCGGDRDPGKRPMMGAIAAELADRVIVTDDNPRSEDPAAIRAAILAGAPGRASRSATAREAIGRGDRRAAPGDVLLIAGKGHETGQIVGKTDAAVQRPRGGRAALRGEAGMSDQPLWTVEAMAQAMRGQRTGALPAVDLRHLHRQPHASRPGEAFFAIKGDNRDGHDFVPAALAKAAPASRSSPPTSAAFPKDAPLLIVPDVLDGLRDLARAARARSQAKIIGVTGSVGKTGTKEALRLALRAVGRDPRLGRLLQQPLGRAALARALPRERALSPCSSSA